MALVTSCILAVLTSAREREYDPAVHPGIVPSGEAFLEQLQKRDSVLIADQLRYGFRLENVKAGTVLGLPNLSKGVMDSIELVRDWKIDTLKIRRKTNFRTSPSRGRRLTEKPTPCFSQERTLRFCQCR